MADRSEFKKILSWSLYDWANSAFATSVIAGFFPIFFKQYCHAGVETTVSTARLGFANSIASIVIAISAPVLGAMADRATAKKKFLFSFALLGIVMTSSLYLVSQGQWLLAFFLYIFATIGFAGGNIFYDSLLITVAPSDKMDFVSSFGLSLGYLGGGILFALNVWMILKPELFGIANTSSAVNISFLTVGIWWAVFSIPLLLYVKEEGAGKPEHVHLIRAGISQLIGTFRRIRQLKTIGLFLAAYWLYIDGVDTIIRMAIDYGLSLGLDSGDLITALLITQFVGFPCAIVFGLLGEKIGARRAILIAIGVYIFVCFRGFLMNSEREFYLLAIVIGMVQGGIQALSRSYYARLIPPDKVAEYFGFYNMIGKYAAIIGPLLMGGTGLLFKNMGFTGTMPTRLSILFLIVLFVPGGILLLFVKEENAERI